MAPFLSPVEKPTGLVMKMVYRMSRRQCGKVMTPLSVFAARMPLAFGTFYGKLSKLDKKLAIPSETAVIIREQVATVNACTFCMDSAKWYAMKRPGGKLARFDALGDYATSPLFTEAERAALDYATELARNRDVQAHTFENLKHFYSDREICDIVWLVASEHLYNLTNLGLGIGSDGLCDIRLQRAAQREPRPVSPRGG